MRSHLQKGEIGTIIAISVLVIVGVSSLVSSVFLSKKQITSSKAAPGRPYPPRPTIFPIPIVISVPAATPTPTAIPRKCSTEGEKYYLTECKGGLGYNCGSNEKVQCTYYTKDIIIGTCGGKDCRCVSASECAPPTATPIPTLVPTAVPASTGLGTGSENQTGTDGPLAYCPDGGIPQTSGFAAGSCDYGKESAGNTENYIDQNNPKCAACIWTNYSGGFPYGQCHYANNLVCRRSDNVGGCAGVCNAACCSGNSPKKDGDVYDQINTPGSSGNVSSDMEVGGEEFTVSEDVNCSGTPICDEYGLSYIICLDGSYLETGTC